MFNKGNLILKNKAIFKRLIFFCKGRGVSKMLSDFIVNLPELPLFVLNEEEYKNAIRNEKWLDQKSKLNFLKKLTIPITIFKL